MHGPRIGQAESLFLKAIRAYESLAADYPNVPAYEYAVASARGNLGNLYQVIGKADKAQPELETAVRILELLVKRPTPAPQHELCLGRAYCNLGSLRAIAGNLKESLSWYAKSIRMLSKLVQSERQWTGPRQSVGITYASWAGAYGKLGRHADAAAAKDKSLAKDDRTRLAEQYAARAVALLAKARAAGYFNRAPVLEHMKNDPDLTPLRDRDDYKKLLRGLSSSGGPTSRRAVVGGR